MTNASDTTAVVEELVHELRERILLGTEPTGTWLRQERLAEEFGVSRTPIREALRSLQAQGLIEVMPHRGALVCGPTSRDVLEARDVRAELEGYAAELAAQWVRDEDLQRLRSAAADFRRVAEEPGPPPAPGIHRRPPWSAANDRFHEAVIEAAGNQRLADVLQALRDSFPRNVTWSTLQAGRGRLTTNVDQHDAVVAAIVDRDPIAARAAMSRHVRHAGTGATRPAATGESGLGDMYRRGSSTPGANPGSSSGTVVEDLAFLLRERILSGAVPTGTWLRQERLAAEFGISRTPVREALRALSAQGIVEVVLHRGVFVCGPTLRDVREAYSIRAELEGYAAELAAQGVNDEHLGRLRAAEELFREAALMPPRDEDRDERRPRWSEANDLFHEAVLDAAGNGRLTDIVLTQHRSFPRNVTWSTLNDSQHLMQENIDQHRAVLQAIIAQDPVTARAEMVNHVRRSGELVAMRFERLQDRADA
jgi:DNA-binding GntR family transcriptional regulator